MDGERIAKRLARAGVCSRRDAERLIAFHHMEITVADAGRFDLDQNFPRAWWKHLNRLHPERGAGFIKDGGKSFLGLAHGR